MDGAYEGETKVETSCPKSDLALDTSGVQKWLFFVVELQKKTRRRGLWLIAHVTGDVAEVRVVESTRKRDKTFSRCASCPNLRAIALSTAAVCHANALA